MENVIIRLANENDYNDVEIIVKSLLGSGYRITIPLPEENYRRI